MLEREPGMIEVLMVFEQLRRKVTMVKVKVIGVRKLKGRLQGSKEKVL